MDIENDNEFHFSNEEVEESASRSLNLVNTISPSYLT